MQWRQNIPLIVGLAIPVLMIVLVIAGIYIPRLLVKPTYDFLYTIDQYPTYVEQRGEEYIEHSYEVREGKLAQYERTIPRRDTYPPRTSNPPKLYLHDVQANTSREILFEEAQRLQLDDSRESPDGFTIGHGGSGGVFPFVFDGGADYNSYYLKGQGASTKLNLKESSDRYYGQFNFMGWVIE